MERVFIRLGAVAGFLGVAFGAFGAHDLRGKISADYLAAFQTAVQYQLIHALALVATGLLAAKRSSRAISAAGWCFAAGIVLFSGSLYVLTITGTTSVGFVTPFGGLLFLAGWICLAIAA